MNLRDAIIKSCKKHGYGKRPYNTGHDKHQPAFVVIPREILEKS